MISEQMEELLKDVQDFHRNFLKNSKIQASQTGLTKEQEEQLMIKVLFKVSTYFIEVTQLCLDKVSPNDASKIKTKLTINKQTLQQLFCKRDEKTSISTLDSPVQDNELELSQQNIDSKAAHITNYNFIRTIKPKHPVSSFFFFFKEKSKNIGKQTGETVGSKIAKIVANIWKQMSQEEREPYEQMAKKTRANYEVEMGKFRAEHADQIAQLKKYKKEQKRQRCNLPKSKKQQLVELNTNKMSNQSQIFPLVNAEINEPEKLGEKLNNSFSFSSDDDSEEDMLSNSLSSQQTLENEDYLTNQPLLQEKCKNIVIIPKHLSNKPKAPVSSFFIYYKEKGKQISEDKGIPLGPKLIKIVSQIWNNLTQGEKEPYKDKAMASRENYYSQMKKFKEQNAETLKLHKTIKASQKLKFT